MLTQENYQELYEILKETINKYQPALDPNHAVGSLGRLIIKNWETAGYEIRKH